MVILLWENPLPYPFTRGNRACTIFTCPLLGNFIPPRRSRYQKLYVGAAHSCRSAFGVLFITRVNIIYQPVYGAVSALSEVFFLLLFRCRLLSVTLGAAACDSFLFPHTRDQVQLPEWSVNFIRSWVRGDQQGSIPPCSSWATGLHHLDTLTPPHCIFWSPWL